jgi:hypothetical protein
MKKSLAELKRDAKAGRLSAEMVIRCGGTDIPERLQGKRKLVDANSVSIFFLNSDGKKSEMPIKAASLLDYTDDFLTIYYPGKRELNAEEQAVMKKWNAIANTEEFKRQSEIDALSDGSCTYWKEKHFFQDSGYEYLFGTEMKQGKKRDYQTGLIIDNAVKGDIEMQYKLYQN